MWSGVALGTWWDMHMLWERERKYRAASISVSLQKERESLSQSGKYVWIIMWWSLLLHNIIIIILLNLQHCRIPVGAVAVGPRGNSGLVLGEHSSYSGWIEGVGGTVETWRVGTLEGGWMGGHRNIPVVGGRRDRVDGGRGGKVEETCENTNHGITM